MTLRRQAIASPLLLLVLFTSLLKASVAMSQKNFP